MGPARRRDPAARVAVHLARTRGGRWRPRSWLLAAVHLARSADATDARAVAGGDWRYALALDGEWRWHPTAGDED